MGCIQSSYTETEENLKNYLADAQEKYILKTRCYNNR